MTSSFVLSMTINCFILRSKTIRYKNCQSNKKVDLFVLIIMKEGDSIAESTATVPETVTIIRWRKYE